MDRIDFEMEYPDILGNFKNFSSSYYICSAALTVFINVLVMCMLTVQKTSRYGSKFKFYDVMLFSVALCDLIYEVTTTFLFLQSSSCNDLKNTTMLYFIYLASNLCTVFHIVVLILGKGMIGSGMSSHSLFSSGLRSCIVAWLSAFVLAYVYIKNDIGLLDKSIVSWLGSFKAFGYLSFDVIFCSGISMISLAVCFSKSPNKSKKALRERFQKPEATQYKQLNASRPKTVSQDDILLSCLFTAFFVGWFAWVVIGVDSRTMLTIEIMRSFEMIRLGARILCPTWLLCSFSHRKEESFLPGI